MLTCVVNLNIQQVNIPLVFELKVAHLHLGIRPMQVSKRMRLH